MKTYYASGTVGDAYVILCKLYFVAKKERILCRHYTAYERLRPVIKDIYSLIPNISVEFMNHRCLDAELTGVFHYQGEERERSRYNLEPEYYPEFEVGDVGRFNLPETYNVLQVKAGSHGYRGIPPENIKRILNGSKPSVVLIGENVATLPTESFDVMNLRGKTSIKEVVGVIKGSKRFYGPVGFLSFLAVSQRIISDVYTESQEDVSAVKMRIEPVEEWRKFLITRG